MCWVKSVLKAEASVEGLWMKYIRMLFDSAAQEVLEPYLHAKKP